MKNKEKFQLSIKTRMIYPKLKKNCYYNLENFNEEMMKKLYSEKNKKNIKINKIICKKMIFNKSKFEIINKKNF